MPASETPLEQTIERAVTLEGTGLHRGGRVVARFRPAPEGSGIVFIRDDLPGSPRVPVTPATARGESRGTQVLQGEVRIHTIEHLMAACWGSGIDNLEVHLDADEVPAVDGSALPFVDLLRSAGIRSQTRPRRIVRILSPVTVGDDGAEITALPSPGLRVAYTLQYANPVIGCQLLDGPLSRDHFPEDIAPARTFCLQEEVEALREQGLARGGSLENALVVDEDRILNPPLRFPDEFVRHKVLDLLGDLAVLGGDVQGRFLARRTGHRQNIELIHEMLRQGAVVMAEPVKNTCSFAEIKQILPHRYPFLLVDRITDMEPGVYAVGIKNVSGNEPFFEGHFPSRPVMPGVLILEALAQVAGVSMLSLPQNAGKIPYFTGLDNVRFRRPVVPGDQMILEVRVQRIRGNMGWLSGQAFVDSKVVAEGTLKFTIR